MYTEIQDFSPDHLIVIAMVALVYLDFPRQPSDFGVDALGAAVHLLPLGTDLCGFGHIFLSSHVRSDDSLTTLKYSGGTESSLWLSLLTDS